MVYTIKNNSGNRRRSPVSQRSASRLYIVLETARVLFMWNYIELPLHTHLGFVFKHIIPLNDA